MTELISKYIKYPAYKNSGVKWLGEIPVEWMVEKGKWLFKKEERPVEPKDGIVTCFRDGQVTLRSNRRIEGFTNALKEHGYQGIRIGDLVIHNMDAFAGAIGVSDSNGKSTPVYSVCTPRLKKQINVFFYAYLLRNLALTGFIESLAKGIRERSTDFRFNDFAKLLLIFPPLSEQTAIANFLDEKTAKIDKAIAQKEKLIALLKERKQIIIQDLVTGKKVWNGKKWVKPEKVKDSGVEWIGEIPEDYSVTKLSLCLKPVSIKNKPDLPLLSITRELGVIIRDTEDQESNHNFIPDDLSSYKVIRKGQFGMNKMKAWQGSYGVSNYDGIISPAYYVFDLISDMNPNFFHLAIRSKTYVPFFAAASDGVRIGQWDLNKSRMKEIPIVVPTLEEQLKVIEHIAIQSKKIADAIIMQQKQIKKLKEYKAVLIDSAITGKIKV